MKLKNALKTLGISAVALGAFATSSCTDATRAKIGGLGAEALVETYSGGVLISQHISTGKVKSEANSDGYFFKDKATGKLIEVSGDVRITYDWEGDIPDRSVTPTIKTSQTPKP